jgi:hypothetical protein
MRPVDPKSYAAHDRSVLERSIEGKHAVAEVPDIAGSGGDVEDGYTQMQHVETHRYGDLVVAPDDYVDMSSIMELIKGIQSKG